MKHLNFLYIIIFGALISSCASPRAAYRKDFNFSQIGTVRIGQFTPAARQPNSGASVANEFIRQLLIGGFRVKTSENSSADVELVGNVTEYLPNNRYLLQTNKTTDGTVSQVIVVNQPVELSGTSAYNLGSTFGLGRDNQVVVSNATVGISAYLRDIVTGEIVWSNTYTYEGLDLDTAMEGTVRYLLRSWPVTAR